MNLADKKRSEVGKRRLFVNESHEFLNKEERLVAYAPHEKDFHTFPVIGTILVNGLVSAYAP